MKSRLHGVSDENPLAPIIRRLGMTLYRTSGDDSILYDHDLESTATDVEIEFPVSTDVSTEVGSLISMGSMDSSEYFHDPSMKSGNAGKVKKILSIKPHADGSGYFISLSITAEEATPEMKAPIPVKLEFTYSTVSGIQGNIAAEFIEKLVKWSKNIKISDPMEEGCRLGPVVSKGQDECLSGGHGLMVQGQ